MSPKLNKYERFINNYYELTAVLEFPECSYMFGFPPDDQEDEVIGKLEILQQTSWGGYLTLAEGDAKWGPLTLSCTVNSNYTIIVRQSFTTTLGHTPPTWNYDVNLKVYLDCGRILDEDFITFENFSYVVQFYLPPTFPAPECSGPPVETELIFNRQDNPFDGQDICEPYNPYAPQDPVLGVTAPAKKTINPIEYSICYDSETNSWRFDIPQIEFNIISDLCDDNFDYYGFRRIDKLEDIPERFICDAIEDIVKHYDLQMQRGDYVLSWVMMKHEDMHREYFEKIFKQFIPEINNVVKNFNVTCEEAKTQQEAEKKWFNLNGLIEKILLEARKKWDLERGVNNPVKWKQHEYEIHHLWPVKWEILSAWHDLHVLYPSFVDCF